MMTLEDFKKSNMCWNGNGYYTTEKEWNSNYQIAKDVEKEFFTHYDKSLMLPQKGDMIEFVNYNSFYNHALVESVDKFGLMYAKYGNIVCLETVNHSQLQVARLLIFILQTLSLLDMKTAYSGPGVVMEQVQDKEFTLQ